MIITQCFVVGVLLVLRRVPSPVQLVALSGVLPGVPASVSAAVELSHVSAAHKHTLKLTILCLILLHSTWSH